jgi:parvulin-like peptidyl-prolyl isomerase
MQGHPRLSQLLKASQPGILLQPTKIDEWWVLLRLESYESQVLDDEMRKLMARELLDEWIHEEVNSLRKQLACRYSLGFQFQAQDIKILA